MCIRQLKYGWLLVLQVSAVGLLSGFVAIAAAANLTPQPEYNVKAAFLYNFARFIEWPDVAYNPPSDTFTLGLLGVDKFDGALDSIDGKSVRGRALRIQHFSSIEEVQDCQILFVSDSERKHASEIVQALNGQPILTVGESASFAEIGGVINFKLVNQKVHFEINPRAAERAGLRVSSRLLSLAEVVEDASVGASVDD